MEPDRYKNNHVAYVVGIICLIASMALLFLSLYIIPFLIWQLHYDIPYFVIHFIAFFEDNYDFSHTQSKWMVWLIFFVASLIFAYFAYYISNWIERRVYNFNVIGNERRDRRRLFRTKRGLINSNNVVFKVVLYIVLVVIVILVIHGLIQLVS